MLVRESPTLRSCILMYYINAWGPLEVKTLGWPFGSLGPGLQPMLDTTTTPLIRHCAVAQCTINILLELYKTSFVLTIASEATYTRTEYPTSWPRCVIFYFSKLHFSILTIDLRNTSWTIYRKFACNNSVNIPISMFSRSFVFYLIYFQCLNIN